MQILAAVLLSILFATPVWSATYYVDPTLGNNSNVGTSTGSAWKSLPGTMNATDDGYDCPDTTVTKIQGGDTIYLKSGETHISRRIVIGSTYYTSGTVGNPITIKRKTDWGSGSFTFDGTSVTFAASYEQLIFIDKIEYVTFDGSTGVSNDYDGIIIQNVSSDKALNGGFQICGTSTSNRVTGFIIKYVKFFGIKGYNLVVQLSDKFSISYVEADGNSSDVSTGIYIGGDSYGNDNGTIDHCYSHHHGKTYSTGGSSVRIGYWLTDSSNITFNDCIAAYNSVRGWDIGISEAHAVETPLYNIVLNRCKAYDNQHAGFGFSGGPVTGDITIWLVNFLAYHNGQGILAYGGDGSTNAPKLYILNGVAAYNTMGMTLGDSLYNGKDIKVRNVIFYNNSGSGYMGAYTPRDLWWADTAAALDSDYNLFDKQSGTYAWKYNTSPSDVNYAHGDTSGKFANGTNGVCATYSQECHSRDSVQTGGWLAQFTNAASYDFSLLATSNAINNGSDVSTLWPSTEPTTDFVGATRSSWDIGAYEYNPASAINSLTGGLR